jgi:hypothetical protein
VRKPGLDGSAWPSERQELLLRAALLDRDAAGAAWAELAPDLHPDRPDEDPEVLRLLPLVHHNLRRAGITDPHADALGAATRQNWYRTRTVLAGAAPALSCLLAAGVPTMVLKGAPLALGYYAHPSLRFLSDVDVLVPTAAAEPSLDLLTAAGWRRQSPIPRRRLFRARHSENLVHDEHGNLDLHWRLSMPLVLAADRERSEEDFWQAAEPLTVAGVKTLAPCPADLVLHVCVHGAWTLSEATARWVADAMTVIRSTGDRMDWDRLTTQIARRRVVIGLRNDLTYLARDFGAPVPGAVLERLRRAPVSRREARTYRSLTRSLPRGGLRETAGRFRGYWLEKTGALPRWRQVRELPGHLEDHWGLAHAWEIPLEAVARLAGHLGLARKAGGD